MQKFKYVKDDIRQYLTQELSESKKIAFETYMAQNTAFEKEVAFMAFVIHKNKQAEREQFTELRKRHAAVATNYRQWRKIAAAILLVVGLGILSYFYLQQPSATQLALQEWQQPQSWSDTRMGSEAENENKLNEQIKAIYKDAYEKYEQKNEQEALTILAKTPNSEEATKTKIWLTTKELEAHIYFEQKDYQKAISIYEDLTSRAIQGKGSAKMKLALCYLADKQNEKAKLILEELVHIKQLEKQAKKLLEAM